MIRPHSNTHLGGIDFGSSSVRHSLLSSFWDGIFANAMLALNENFGTAAAVRLQAPNWVFPLLTALPVLLGAAAQFLLPTFANLKKGRKHYVLLGVRLQSLGLFLCGWAGWLPESIAAYAFVALFVFAAVSGTATGGFWMAWMSDLVSPALRGRHFAWRGGFFSLSNLICSLTAGMLARQFSSQTAPWLLFSGVFTASAAFRFISYLYLRRQHETPPTELAPVPLHRYRPPSGLTSFAIASSLFQGAASVAGIFFSVWYLRDLHFNYLTFSIASSCTILGSILAIRWWGHLIDKRGCVWVLRISGFLIIFIPLPYLFIHTPGWIWLFNIFGGACWAGFNLANFNCILQTSGQEGKSQDIAFTTLISGISLTLFGLLAGWLADHIPVIFGWRLQSVFLVSAILRLVLWLGLLSRLRLPSPSA